MGIAVPYNWDDEAYLRENPDVRACIEKDQGGCLKNGYEHYSRYGVLEGRKPAWRTDREFEFLLPHPEFEANFGRSGLPDWVGREALRLSGIEPGLLFNDWSASKAWDPFGKAEWGESLHALCSGLKHRDYSHMFFLPWLKRGGADLASLWHLRAAVGQGSRILVVLTERAESEWLEKVPEGVDVLQFGGFLGYLPLDGQALCAYHLVSAIRPDIVHVINSHVGWRMLLEYRGALPLLADIYVSLYCYDHTRSGEPVGYARDIRRCAMGIKMIFTDNSWFADHLTDCLGIDAAKVVVLRHPVVSGLTLPEPSLHSQRILWAGRLDRQKRPELLIKVARQMPSLRFDVFGASVMESTEHNAVIRRFADCDNIEYHGPFDNFASVINDDYRLMLYTAAWDGLPNILLEAMHAGLLVVAPALGGIADDLGPQHCVLVKEIDNPDAYTSAIRRAYEEAEKAEIIRLRGMALVRERHTMDKFVAQLRSAGYLRTESPVTDDVITKDAQEHSNAEFQNKRRGQRASRAVSGSVVLDQKVADAA